MGLVYLLKFQIYEFRRIQRVTESWSALLDLASAVSADWVVMITTQSDLGSLILDTFAF
jgi:hypothetical protein